jgi:hypothetical protein
MVLRSDIVSSPDATVSSRGERVEKEFVESTDKNQEKRAGETAILAAKRGRAKTRLRKAYVAA